MALPFAHAGLWCFRLSIALLLILTTPRDAAFSATWFRVVNENIDELNYPDRDIWFSPKCNIVMSGSIDEDTLGEFHAAVAEYSNRRSLKRDRPHDGGFPALCMESSGGDLRAAFDLTGDLRFQSFIRVVQKDKICASACALVFIGRKVFWEENRSRKYLHISGHLRFHAPALDDVSSEGAQLAYDRSRLTIADLLFDDFRNPSGFVDGDPCIKNNIDRKTLPDAETERQILCGARISPNLPDSLIYMFLATPHDKYVEVDTVEKALFWGIQLYGLKEVDLSRVSDFWMWQACDNARWLQCHHSTDPDLKKGCDYDARTRPSFNEISTIPLQLNRMRGNILRLTQHTPDQRDLSVERISIGAVAPDAKQEQDRPIENARCGISVFRNRSFVNLVVQPRPKNIEWRKGKLGSLALTDREIMAAASDTAVVDISPATINAVIMRPWAWLPVDTRLNETEDRLVKLNELAISDAESLSNVAYRVLNVCNDGPWLCPTSSNPWQFCDEKKKSSKTVFGRPTLHFAIGALRENKITFRGWYNVETDHCVVPDEIHFGEEFYIAAFDADGAPVKVFTENSGTYKPETQQMRGSLKECADASDVFKHLHSDAEFRINCNVQANDVATPSLKNISPDEALKNLIVLSPASQITTIILTKGPNKEFGWFVGNAVKASRKSSP